MRDHFYPLLIAVLLPTAPTMAQGCSDAGVCTAGPLGRIANNDDSTNAQGYQHFARLQYSTAVGEQGVLVMQVVPEIGIGVTDRFGVQLKVPFVSASGNLGENSGIGDMIFTTSYAFVKERDRDFSAIVGLRIPTGETSPQPLEQTSFGPDFKPLPMPYQPGLGTLDLLLGAQYRYKRWTTTLAYQHVLSQGNENLFFHEAWDDNADALKYFESAYLERANDAVARLQYALPFRKLTIQPGLLAIYHLGLDSRFEVDGTPSPWDSEEFIRRDVEGSDGLTLNLTADARYALSDHWSLEASYGSPVITREVRPDGLTRSMVLNVGVRFAF
ncbi:MAG TPA: hypothetical protein PLB89_14215 [Flavobacteriales bacterium]|nr:hypothetical protein [Flavobacteriales bacterium]